MKRCLAVPRCTMPHYRVTPEVTSFLPCASKDRSVLLGKNFSLAVTAFRWNAPIIALSVANVNPKPMNFFHFPAFSTFIFMRFFNKSAFTHAMHTAQLGNILKFFSCYFNILGITLRLWKSGPFFLTLQFPCKHGIMPTGISWT